jgi:DsbC/DsbD-like thiol-disulfide interchange protein
MGKNWLIPLLLLSTACSGEEGDGAPPPPSKVVDWSATGENLRKAPDGGTIVDVTLRATVEPGWKLYSLTQGGGGPVAMTVKLDSLSPYKLAGEVRGPAADKAMDPNFNIETETYSGEAIFVVPVHIPVVGGSAPIDLKVRSQACSDRLCLPARTTTVSLPAPPEDT